jgi:hypothetical protein
MTKNISSIDRIIRVVLAMVFTYLYFSGVVAGTVGLVLFILAIVFLLTSLLTFCPIYAIFGFSTNKKSA